MAAADRFTPGQAATALREFGRGRFEVLRELANDGAGVGDGFSAVLVFAISLRESHGRNIVGDAGHGRGFLQIDDRSHQSFLRSHAGCKSGSWIPTNPPMDGGALEAGHAPGMVAATDYAQALLRGNATYARTHGVPSSDRRRFAIAAYNCGAGNALRSYQEGGIENIDARTAGKDYSKDVLANEVSVRAALKTLAWI